MADISNWKNKNRTIEKFFESVGGTAEGKPHSTREGRIAAGKRDLKRYVQKEGKKHWRTIKANRGIKLPKEKTPKYNKGGKV